MPEENVDTLWVFELPAVSHIFYDLQRKRRYAEIEVLIICQNP